MDKLVLDNKEYRGLVSKICQNIAKAAWRPEYVVGIGRGGLLPAVMISHYFDLPMQSVDISLRDSGYCVSNLGMADDAFERKNILIVDDINDTGATFNWLMNDWKSSAFPDNAVWNYIWNQNVKFAVVVDNIASKCNAKMDFVGMEVNKSVNDVWVKFPYEEWWVE